MNAVGTRVRLSEQRKRLLEEFIRIYYGTLYCLEFRDCEPIVVPMPRSKAKILLGQESDQPRRVPTVRELLGKSQVRDLFRQFDSNVNGTFSEIEIRGGVPHLVIIERKGGQ